MDKLQAVANRPRENPTPGDEKRGDVSEESCDTMEQASDLTRSSEISFGLAGAPPIQGYRLPPTVAAAVARESHHDRNRTGRLEPGIDELGLPGSCAPPSPETVNSRMETGLC